MCQFVKRYIESLFEPIMIPHDIICTFWLDEWKKWFLLVTRQTIIPMCWATIVIVDPLRLYLAQDITAASTCKSLECVPKSKIQIVGIGKSGSRIPGQAARQEIVTAQHLYHRLNLNSKAIMSLRIGNSVRKCTSKTVPAAWLYYPNSA